MSTGDQQNRTNLTDPDMADVLELYKKETMLAINCCHVGTVQSFDPSKQTVTATVNYKRTYFDRKADGTYIPVLQSYPLIIDCPVVGIRGGTAGLTMPIAVGDECLLIFNDRSIDAWFASGQIQGTSSSRLHSFSDAFALVGVRSSPNALSDYDANRAVLYKGETKVAVGTKVEISNQLQNLNDLLASLIDTIKAITTTNAVVGVPCLISATSQTALDSVKTEIAQLLE